MSVAVAVLLVTAACARRDRFPPPPIDPSIPVDSAPPAEPPRPVALRVENRNRADVVVYASRGTVRTRLGTVTAQTSAELVIPATFVGDAGGLHLVGDPVGGRTRAQSPQFTLRNGQRVVWTLDTNLSRSSLAAY